MTDIARAQQMIDRYYDAEMAVLDGRTVTMNGRTLTMVDLNSIREGRKEWERRLGQLKNRRSRPYGVARFE